MSLETSEDIFFIISFVNLSIGKKKCDLEKKMIQFDLNKIWVLTNI